MTKHPDDLELDAEGNLVQSAAPSIHDLLLGSTRTGAGRPPLNIRDIIAAVDEERRRNPKPPGVYITEHGPLQRIVENEDGSEKTVQLLCCGLPGDRLGDRHRYLVHPDRFALFKSTVERCGFKLEATGKPLPEAPWILVPAGRR